MKFVFVALFVAAVFALDNGLALTPPMVCTRRPISFVGLARLGTVPLRDRLRQPPHQLYL